MVRHRKRARKEDNATNIISYARRLRNPCARHAGTRNKYCRCTRERECVRLRWYVADLIATYARLNVFLHIRGHVRCRDACVMRMCCRFSCCAATIRAYICLCGVCGFMYENVLCTPLHNLRRGFRCAQIHTCAYVGYVNSSHV